MKQAGDTGHPHGSSRGEKGKKGGGPAPATSRPGKARKKGKEGGKKTQRERS